VTAIALHPFVVATLLYPATQLHTAWHWTAYEHVSQLIEAVAVWPDRDAHDASAAHHCFKFEQLVAVRFLSTNTICLPKNF